VPVATTVCIATASEILREGHSTAVEVA